jgi:hypothetical protein
MATDYEEIRRDNIEEYGKGTRHLEFLGRLYSDKTHFIYELLQNAEDARAAKVSFVLEPSRLIFKHNGTELFNERHIRGICGVAEGTKAEDETKIGKFGIGFKSVYAYTRIPEIHCAAEHFRIEHFVRPFQESVVNVDPPWTTVFIFPFHEDLETKPEVANQKIQSRLAFLSDQTLLFLNNLREIEWEVVGKAKGSYKCEKINKGGHQRVVLQSRSNFPNLPTELNQTWMLFSRQFTHEGKTTPFNVEAAFRLDKDQKTGKEVIQRITEAPLVVYFPTAIQTGLGFLIQGPYRTTPARDNIREDNPVNLALVRETGDLIVEALRTIKSLGLLSLEVLNALPIKTKNDTASIIQRMTSGPSREEKIFGPMTNRVAQAIKEEDLLPAHPNGFVSGQCAILARTSELREFIDSNQLQTLFNTESSMKWLAGSITADRTPELRSFLLETIGVAELTPEDFAQKLTDDFLEKQPDEWFVSFYYFLTGQKALWRTAQGDWIPAGPLRYAKNIIRLEDESLVPPYRSDEQPYAYLPPDSDTEFPTVKKSIAVNPKAKEFLVTIGLTLPDLVDEVIEKVLPKYKKQVHQISNQEHLHDIARIASAAKTDSKVKRDRLLALLRNTAFLRCKNAKTGELTYQRPAVIHFVSVDINLYFGGNPNAHFLSEQYQETYFELLAEIGVAKMIRHFSREPRYDGHVVIRDYHGWHERGLSGFDPDYSIEGLEFAIANPTLARSQFVWNSILLPHAAKMRGEVESSSRQDFSYGKKEMTFSKAGKLVTDHAWLPDRTGQWHRPKGFSVAKLPDGFQESETLCRILQMDFVSVTQLAEKTGIPLGYLEAIKNLHQTSPQILEKFMQSISGPGNNVGKPNFPKKPVVNSERRDQKMRERTSDPSDKTYETKGRRIRTSKPDLDVKAWLSNQYTNEDCQVICQMCEQEMPFKNREGNYYFEAVEAIPNLGFENHQLFLALCPLCAAKYQEFVKRDEDVVAAFKQCMLAVKDTDKILLRINQLPNTIRFVDTHLFDLKRILEKTS